MLDLRVHYQFGKVRRSVSYLEAGDLGEWLAKSAPDLSRKLGDAAARAANATAVVEFSTVELDAIESMLALRDLRDSPGLADLRGLLESRPPARYD